MITDSLQIPSALNANYKTKELVLYVANQLKDDPKYGAIILNKTLYFIDCVSFMETDKPISDFTYIKQGRGPTPNPSQFLNIKDNLLSAGEAQEVKIDYFGRIQKKLIPTREADLNLFELTEIVLIDKVIKYITINHNAASISDFTHNMLAWKAAKPMEELPFYTFLLTSATPSKADISWGLKVKQSRK